VRGEPGDPGGRSHLLTGARCTEHVSAVQDTLCTAGLVTTAGAAALRGYMPPYDAAAVARLRAAGALVLGKCNCDAFAMGSTTEASDYQARNRLPVCILTCHIWKAYACVHTQIGSGPVLVSCFVFWGSPTKASEYQARTSAHPCPSVGGMCATSDKP